MIEIKNPAKPWWPGDSRVEPYMPRVSEALSRRGITGDAKMDIYNRAYEAVYYAIKDMEILLQQALSLNGESSKPTTHAGRNKGKE